jgi:hypothetical protein
MQGAASAVEWYGDYIYLAAASVLQVYHAPSGTGPNLVREIELRDWAREMDIAGNTLFIAARGDGLYAFDLVDPAHPEPAGRVSGLFDAGDYTSIEAVFNGVYAQDGRVAVARANNIPQDQGGVDAIVFDYDATTDTFTPVRVIGTEVRSRTTSEVPTTLALTEDAHGLYIGYTGELVYVPLDDPLAPILSRDLGVAMSIATEGDTAFVAISNLNAPWVEVSMLSRVSIVEEALVEEPILTNLGSSPGGSVDIHQDLLCFGTWSPARYEDGYNLWVFTDLLEETPTRMGAAGTMDWVYQLACRDSETGPDWVYVADEWGGLEVWQSNGVTLTLNLVQHRMPTGALSLGLWNDGSRVYSAKKGAGLWVFDETDPQHEWVAVEWIDRSDPGCACEGCCPPAVGPRPYPPAIFVVKGTSNQGRVALFGQDRNTAVEGDGYFMVFEEKESSGEYECVYSDPITATAWGGQTVGGHTVKAVEEILFVSSSVPTLRLYQHCPAEPDSVRFLTEIQTPIQGTNMEISDVAVYQDYLFMTEVHKPWLVPEQSGVIHVYRWKQGDLAVCPARPSLLSPPVYLGSFGADFIPFRLLVDSARDQLIVGCVSNPFKPGKLLLYDLSAFDPANPAAMDDHYSNVSPDESIRVTEPNIYDLLLDGDVLYVVDFDNGLYQYSFGKSTYVRFYPAHRGTTAQYFVPQLVQSPEGTVPLHHPVSVALMPSRQIMVQEHVSGRVSILSQIHQVYLPLVEMYR